MSPYFRLGVSHELGQTRRTASAALAVLPDSPFDVTLSPEERTWFELNLAVPYRPMAGLEFVLHAGAVLNDRTGGQFIGVMGRIDW